ncbi:glycosyltransferase family 4 protein [Pseudokineococcus sp. 1T1Z-3]|uniref:glycosyltransferase family 4 protein n=1 Tax=Pseudokineococcus sp. 1T1Z-3 TaxID=3132745 RepID=UPI00309A269D
MSALSRPGTATGEVGAVVYVVLDPGVPAYGRKGCSVHVQEVLRDLVRRARAGGHEVHLVAARLGGEAPEGLEDVVVHELGRPRADGPAASERALVALDARAGDLVARLVGEAVAEQATSGGPAPLVYQRYGLWSAAVLERAAAAGATTALEVNAPLVEEQERHRVLVDRTLAVTTTQRALRAADVVVAVSAAVATWAREMAGRDVLVLPNGVDADRFTVTGGPRQRGDAEPLVVGFVGTFRPWHGLEELVEATAAVARSGDAVRLLLVGDGPTREAVLARAAAAGVDVEAPGAVAPHEVPGLLARCDVAAAPYPGGQTYFSPLKLVEYLAAGLPVVASAVADVPSLFRRDELLLVPPGDGPALAAALGRLVREPALRARLAARGRAAALERFGWHEVVGRTLEAAATGHDERSARRARARLPQAPAPTSVRTPAPVGGGRG